MSTLAYNEVIVDSCEGYSIRAVHAGSPLSTPVTCYQVYDESADSVMEVYKADKLSFAEQRLDDLANESHYENLRALPLLKKTAKVLTA